MLIVICQSKGCFLPHGVGPHMLSKIDHTILYGLEILCVWKPQAIALVHFTILKYQLFLMVGHISPKDKVIPKMFRSKIK